jgi:hypothetical protein
MGRIEHGIILHILESKSKIEQIKSNIELQNVTSQSKLYNMNSGMRAKYVHSLLSLIS